MSRSGGMSQLLKGIIIGVVLIMAIIGTMSLLDKDNPLSKLGDINLWINSKAYNFVENAHQLWLLTLCDLIIGKREYLPN